MPPLKRCLQMALCLPLLALPALLCAPRAQALAAAGNISLEQVYVNVPEMDVFVRAQDAGGAPLSPQLVRAAGVELRLGDTQLETGNVQAANETVCYIFVLDNSIETDPGIFRHFKNVVIRTLQRKAGHDQVALYAMDAAGTPVCVLPPTTDSAAVRSMLRTLACSADAPLDLTAAASLVYGDIEAGYQNLAPRKVVVGMTEAVSLLGNLPLLATMGTGLADELNMRFSVLAVTDDELEQELLGQFRSGHLLVCEPADIEKTVEADLAALPGVIEFKTAIDPALYGERWETLTLSVPSMGSAVTASTTVYMGHRLAHPAIEAVDVTGRRELTVTFNQAVSAATAGLPGAYLLQSEDVWGFRLGVRGVELRQDGLQAVLTTSDDLYAGPYSVRLRGVAAALSAANTSDAQEKTAFSIETWPRDRAFYLARLRLPGLILAAALLVLAAGAALRARRERAAEQEAEVEHLLTGAEDIGIMPRRWLTLFLQPPGAITENRWSGVVESSLLIGADAALCELCVPDAHMAAQHCILSLDGDAVLLQPLGRARVYVNGRRLDGAWHLRAEDTVKIGGTQLRAVL